MQRVGGHAERIVQHDSRCQQPLCAMGPQWGHFAQWGRLQVDLDERDWRTERVLVQGPKVSRSFQERAAAAQPAAVRPSAADERNHQKLAFLTQCLQVRAAHVRALCGTCTCILQSVCMTAANICVLSHAGSLDYSATLTQSRIASRNEGRLRHQSNNTHL
jgi:hypothetical protein